MKDILAQGGQFTWKGGLNNCRMARLHKFIISEDWDYLFGTVNQSILPRPTLDHFPILREGGRRRAIGLAPFRFENMWIKEEGFKDLIRDWWQSFEFRGTNSYVLMEKIKSLKSKLKIWNKDVFGRVEENKKNALSKVAAWDDLEDFKEMVSYGGKFLKGKSLGKSGKRGR